MAPDDVAAVYEALSRTGGLLEGSELSDVPSRMQVIEAPDTAKHLLRRMATPEDRDDVQRVSSRFGWPAPPMADLSSMV